MFRSAFENPTLRRVGFAYALFGTAEFGIWIALLVFAYGHGGATAGMLMALVQLVPSIALGPFLGALADRRRPSRVLFVGYALQALSMAVVATAVGLRAPVVVVFALAPLTSLAITVTRPSQAALLPAIVRTADELTAANVMSGWTDGAGALVGPGVLGILLYWRGPALAIAVTAGMTAVSMLLVARVTGPAAAILPEHAADVRDDDRDGAGDALASGTWSALASIRAGARANLAVALRNPQIRVLLTLHTFYFTLIGALDLLCVILAASFLHMSSGGAGFLNAALGGGALLAGFVTAFLVGRRHLANTFVVAITVAVAALAIIAAVPRVAPVILLIGTVGLAGAVFDVTGRTLLQRSAPADAIAGSFSILEALMDLGLALGAILVRVALAIGGLKAALFGPAVIAFVLIGGLWRQLRKIDASATIPQVEIQLLRSISIFAALPAPCLEGIARELEPVAARSGTVVIAEGEPGDCYYAVADGELAVTRDGLLLQTVSRGDGFGEIALIRDIPRQASVTTVCDASLFKLHKELFIQTVTGHVRAASAAKAIAAGHIGEDPADGPGKLGPDIS
ncbi:MAG: cyclic nucleotide-binding domain-containing protein [Acidimicrobiales bacterium]